MLKRSSIGGQRSCCWGLGCAAEEAGGSEVGQLALPLVSNGSGGTQFALAANFDLTGPETIAASRTAADGNFLTEDVLTLNPRVGTYSLVISNWTLYRVNAAMTPPLVAVPDAVLNGPATQTIEIFRDQTTNVIYEFNVPGTGTIVFARGTLNIDFTVGEGFPNGAACTDSAQCASLVCEAGMQTCAPASCSDGIQNGDETSPTAARAARAVAWPATSARLLGDDAVRGRPDLRSDHRAADLPSTGRR